jgi:radical SAM protein with 4Fe4S-binding SPASM domain
VENPFKEVYRQCNTMTEDIPFPRMIDIEVTNACNMECRMCPVGTGKMKRKTGFMDERLFNVIADEIGAHKTPVRFIRWGEPTLHPTIRAMVLCLRNTGCLVHVNTNGLQPQRLKANSIKFSFQGTDSISYAKMRGKDMFRRIISEMKTYWAEEEDTYISAGTTITEESGYKVREFIALVKSYVHHVSVGKTMLPPYEGLTPNRDCHEVFNKLSINWDGTVSACCRDYDNMMIVGDLRRNTLEEIWKGKEMEGWRERIRQGDYSHPLCKDCYKYIEMEGE